MDSSLPGSTETRYRDSLLNRSQPLKTNGNRQLSVGSKRVLKNDCFSQNFVFVK